MLWLPMGGAEKMSCKAEHRCRLMILPYETIKHVSGNNFLLENPKERYCIPILYCPFCGVKLK